MRCCGTALPRYRRRARPIAAQGLAGCPPDDRSAPYRGGLMRGASRSPSGFGVWDSNGESGDPAPSPLVTTPESTDPYASIIWARLLQALPGAACAVRLDRGA